MVLKKAVLLGTTIFSCFSLSVFAQQMLHPLPKSKNAFIVIAHRGSHLIKPENTIASIEEAIAIGADYVELDLRTTRDGQLVLLHNDRVDQLSNGSGKIKDLDFSVVKELVLMGKDSSVHHIASFDEALKTCKGKINIYLDFKSASVEKAYKAIQYARMEKHVLVYVNSAEDYPTWRKIAPEMPLMSRLDQTISTKEDLLKTFEKTPLEAIDNIPAKDLLPAVRALGINIFPDVQKSSEIPEEWMEVMNKGVQGMQTDHPKALIEYLETNKLRSRRAK